MRLKILGSSSAGNCYVFDNGKEALVVECGIPFGKVKDAVGYDITRIAGAIVSHEHGDHAKYVGKFLDARVPVYMSAGTLRKVCGGKDGFLPFPVESGRQFHAGHFTVMPFDIQHDAAEPFGFLIFHEEMGTVLFATDTSYLKYRFSGLSNILIECNYRIDILDGNISAGRLSPSLRDRTIKSHMSYDTCKETLLANDLSAVNNIVLVHLSDGNSNASQFIKGIQDATCKNVSVASPGMNIKLNKTPF